MEKWRSGCEKEKREVRRGTGRRNCGRDEIYEKRIKRGKTEVSLYLSRRCLFAVLSTVSQTVQLHRLSPSLPA